MSEPTYKDVEFCDDDGLQSLPAVTSCSICGAVVEVDKCDVNTAWHQRIAPGFRRLFP